MFSLCNTYWVCYQEVFWGFALIEEKQIVIEKYTATSPNNFNNKWRLPPSKSHLQRALLLSSTMKEKTVINDISCIGNDSLTMIECLNKMGSKIEFDLKNERIIIDNDLRNELHPPNFILNCNNSATTLKLLIAFCSRFEKPITFDGDETLRKRPILDLLNQLESVGARINLESNVESLPLTISGPIYAEEFLLDISKSSQSLSSLIISGVNANKKFKIKTTGTPASKNHSELTIRMSKQTGAKISKNSEDEIVVEPWVPKWKNKVVIPGDASLGVYCMLWSIMHNQTIILEGFPNEEDSLGCYNLIGIANHVGLSLKDTKKTDKILSPSGIIKDGLSIDLIDSIDILPALSALLALSCGGTLIGINNAEIKESNRIIETQRLLSFFGLKTNFTDGTMIIPGNQIISKPENVIPIPYDHRINMLAILLGSAVGASIEFNNSYEVTDPLFINRLLSFGLKISYS